MVEHWVSAIDRWVRKFDEETGGETIESGEPAGGGALPADPGPL